MGAFFCDIDGTLSDDRWRRKYFDEAKERFKKTNCPAEFDIYNQFSPNDTVYPDIRDFVNEYMGDVVLITSRTGNFRDITEKWAKNNNIKYKDVRMRMRRDGRPNWVVKACMIQDYVRINRSIVKYIIDDDPNILRLRSHYPDAELLIAENGALKKG